MKQLFLTAVLTTALITFLDSCKNKELVQAPVTAMDTIVVEPPSRPVYRASKTRTTDILHTKLTLSFNWDSAFAYGEAELTISPYFYELNTVELDAKGFEILRVGTKNGDDITPLKYNYDQKKLQIDLPEPMQRDDSAIIYIQYVARPNKLELGGSSAIAGDKGLYFINPDGSDPNKPRQIWTQGETEANSCWFPTVDSPNERFTTDIYLTIEEGLTSVSNGMKMFSVSNNDGTKTEYWKMDQPHAAYLVMLAIGPFAEYQDNWNDMEVNYYLDSAYLPYAHDIFGATPEMIGFFSDYLGVMYPWPKYDQVVVRDYVSGAMENTTATIHGEFVQQTKREMIDYNHQDIIAHELFHHWFGDLVTCESWSNLTLNEGFATYGEVLWNEHKNGINEADVQIDLDLQTYMREAEHNQVDLIRFHYDDKEDMFDAHSYSKGARVLHMLRNYVGDDAFRASLELYLNKHAYKNVEIHDLRLAFEEVTGEDLNWFFNQWFLASGHPILHFKWEYNTDNKTARIFTEQLQDTEDTPIYKLPVKVELHNGMKALFEEITIENVKDTFEFEVASRPDYINIDPRNILLADVRIDQSNNEWIAQFNRSERYLDKKEALSNLHDTTSFSNRSVFEKAMDDEFWAIRKIGLNYFKDYLSENADSAIMDKVRKMAETDENTYIRSLAISVLTKAGDQSNYLSLYEDALKDSSYSVLTSAFEAISEADSNLAKSYAKDLEKEDQLEIVLTVADLYASYGDPGDLGFFERHAENMSGFGQYSFVLSFGQYLSNQDDEVLIKELPYFRKTALEGNAWWVRLSGITVIMNNHEEISEEIKSLEESIENMDEDNPNYTAQKETLRNKKRAFDALDELWKEISANETYPRLLALIHGYNSNLSDSENRED